jgi:hypothetical protein
MVMDDDDEELGAIVRNLKASSARRRGLDTTYDDITDTNEGLVGEWGEWMCPSCGIFMKDTRRTCLRCRAPRC